MYFLDECAQIVVETVDPVKHSLISFEAIVFQCTFIDQYLRPYFDKSLDGLNSSDVYFESITNTITKFSNRESCVELTSNDIANFSLNFKYCIGIYRKLETLDLVTTLSSIVAEELKISPICRDINLINTYKFLVDKHFYFKNSRINVKDMYQNKADEDLPIVRFSTIYLSINKTDSKFLLPFYQDFLKANFLDKPITINFENRNYRIAGINFDIKNDLFKIYIRSNLIYILVLLLIVYILVVLYLKA